MPSDIVDLFQRVDEQRVMILSANLRQYITTNLPAAFTGRAGLSGYRTNPYVLLTAASLMRLGEPQSFAKFLFNSKLYMALETSFGKSVEKAFVEQYPINSEEKWSNPLEKEREFQLLEGLTREERARRRTESAWREIDKACVVGTTRYLITIKSGPNTINDTQVQAMTDAINRHRRTWHDETRRAYPHVNKLDLVIGLSYGTDRTTNNKDNQILAKMLQYGFQEEDRITKPGVLIDSETRSIRLYRRVGRQFWAFIGNPSNPESSAHLFLEILLALARALALGLESTDIEDRINAKIQELSLALSNIRFPRRSLPHWVREDFTEDQLFWFATALSGFYDEGI